LGSAQCRLRKHVYETGGELGILGFIKQYWFHYKKEAAYLLVLTGEVSITHERVMPNSLVASRQLEASQSALARCGVAV
jgi:hypothetical protein